MRPEMTIGPYFVDEQLNRSDIRTEPSDNSVKEGVPLTLAIGVFDVANNSCTPLTDAQVDIWHCDALGVYSGVSDQGFDTTGQQFLRGYQLTDGTGKVQFLTIYPGWYSGRAVHIHFTIRTKAADGSDYQFTSQFFFDDALTDQVHAQEPYASKGQRDTRNSSDNIFTGGGDQLLLAVQGDNTNGYNATINIGLDLTDIEVGASDSAGGARWRSTSINIQRSKIKFIDIRSPASVGASDVFLSGKISPYEQGKHRRIEKPPC